MSSSALTFVAANKYASRITYGKMMLAGLKEKGKIDVLATPPFTLPSSILSSSTKALTDFFQQAIEAPRYSEEDNCEGEPEYGDHINHQFRACDFDVGEHKFAMTTQFTALTQCDMVRCVCAPLSLVRALSDREHVPASFKANARGLRVKSSWSCSERRSNHACVCSLPPSTDSMAVPDRAFFPFSCGKEKARPWRW